MTLLGKMQQADVTGLCIHASVYWRLRRNIKKSAKNPSKMLSRGNGSALCAVRTDLYDMVVVRVYANFL